MNSKRNHYLDFCRGLVAINVILIHIFYGAGYNYTPDWCRNLSLILDVPFFFFLAGWSRGLTSEFDFSKTLKSLVTTYKRYVQALILITIVGIMVIWIGSGDFPVTRTFLNDAIASLVFKQNFALEIGIFFNSMWFLQVYFTVIPLTTLLLGFMKLQNSNLKKGSVILFFCFLFGYLATFYGTKYFDINFSLTTWFYSLFFLEGYILAESKPLKIKQFLILAVALGIGVIFCFIKNPNFTTMQSLKFPPHFSYFIYSQIFIVIALYFKRLKIKSSNIFALIGRHAINFYFCQGITTSLLFNIIPHFNMNVPLKLLVCFSLGLITTVILAYLLNWFYKIFDYVEKHTLVILKKIFS